MHRSNTSKMDIDGLRALEALLLERHVSRAARRVNLSQPAMSRALARLRAHFEDDLLVRGADGYELTHRAADLLQPLRRVLQDFDALSHPLNFAPERFDEQLTIAGLDFELQLYLPRLLTRLERDAPHAKLRSLAFSHGDFRVLDDNLVDFVITAFPSTSQFYRRRLLYTNEFACVMSADLARRLEGRMTLEQFIALPHGLVSFEGQGEGQVDAVLRSLGLGRQIAVRVPGFLMVPAVCAARDVVFTLPTRIGSVFSREPELSWLPAPLDIPGTRTFLHWHPRTHLSPAHQWFRELVFETTAEIDSLVRAASPVA